MSLSTLSKSIIYTPNDIERKGLKMLKISKKTKSQRRKTFKKHYGSDGVTVANIWHDISNSDFIDPSEKAETGVHLHLVAHYFLWQYPRNSESLASRFPCVCERHCRREPLWKHIRRIQALKEQKIVWNSRLDDRHTEIYVITIDGIDCCVWEKKDPMLPVNRRNWSHKLNQIGLSIFEPKCVWVNGPFRGGKHDMTIYKEDGLRDKLKPHKRAIVDRGYSDHRETNLSRRSGLDSKELDRFKARASLRHETFNGRLKKFNVLRETFQHC